MSWKRKGVEKPIELIFNFDTPRKFNKVNLFTANLIHLGIQVRIWILISADRKMYTVDSLYPSMIPLGFRVRNFEFKKISWKVDLRDFTSSNNLILRGKRKFLFERSWIVSAPLWGSMVVHRVSCWLRKRRVFIF